MTNPVTYNCPHCRKPFSVVPTAQAQVVSCPSCRGQVTIGPQQPAAPPPRQAPVPPPPQPQVPRPPPQQPMQPQYQQQYPQQPYPQQPYPQQYQQPMAPTPTPKKSKKGPVIAVIIVVVILIVAVLAYMFVLAPGEEEEEGFVKPGAAVTAQELSEDWNPQSGKFKGLEDGDTIIIRDEISEIEHIGFGESYYGDINWTLVTFESTGMTVDKFYSADFSDPSDLFGMIIFDGDLTTDFEEGDKVDVELTIVDYDLQGQTAELPEWYVGILDVSLGYIDFEDIEFQGSSTISHTE